LKYSQSWQFIFYTRFTIHGFNRIGGNAGTETLVFGRIAGQQAADSIQ
jgi:succinate dehydrogenase/fumarate reductase flavoprotein subunit